MAVSPLLPLLSSSNLGANEQRRTRQLGALGLEGAVPFDILREMMENTIEEMENPFGDFDHRPGQPT